MNKRTQTRKLLNVTMQNLTALRNELLKGGRTYSRYLLTATDRLVAIVKTKIGGDMTEVEAPRKTITVRQLGLATGQVITVRRPRRIHIDVKYIPSK